MRLLPNENVQWTTKKGFFSISIIPAFFAIIGGSVLALFGYFGGQSTVNPFPPNPILGWIGGTLALVGIGYMIFHYLLVMSTRYIMTDQRIVETRFDRIVKEIMFTDFMGKPISQFFDKQITGTVNFEPVYTVTITNPKSLNPIEFKALNASAVEALEQILERARQVVRCKYCGIDNSATSFACSRCGAPLH